MEQKYSKLTKVQKLAWLQIVLIVGQVVLGFVAFVNTAKPEPGVEASSINPLNQIIGIFLVVFGVPAVLVLSSAAKLTKPTGALPASEVKTAFKMQTVVFMICVIATIPSMSLAFNGFWLVLADCIFGIISWVVIRKELKA